MDLHVLQPDQDDVPQRAKSHDPPKDGGQSRGNAGEPCPAKQNKIVQLPYGLGVKNDLAFLGRLEGSQILE